MPKKFRTFMLANTEDQNLAREALALLEFIPKSWESHRRQLPVPQHQLGDELYHALLSATGEGVKRIHFLPFCPRKNEPPAVDPHEMVHEVENRIAYSLPECVTGYLDFEKPYIHDRLTVKIDAELSEGVERVFESHLEVVIDTIYYFLSFVILGERERAEMMIPLIKVLPRVIPLGEITGEPGAWLALSG